MAEPPAKIETAGKLHLSARHRASIEALVRKHVPGVEVWAYGSRVSGRSHDGSDLDLVLRGPGLGRIEASRLATWRMRCETLRSLSWWRCTTGHDCRRAFTPRSSAGTWCWFAESQADEWNVQASACSLFGLPSGPNASQVPLKKMRFSGGSFARVSLLGRR